MGAQNVRWSPVCEFMWIRRLLGRLNRRWQIPQPCRLSSSGGHSSAESTYVGRLSSAMIWRADADRVCMRLGWDECGEPGWRPLKCPPNACPAGAPCCIGIVGPKRVAGG